MSSPQSSPNCIVQKQSSINKKIASSRKKETDYNDDVQESKQQDLIQDFPKQMIANIFSSPTQQEVANNQSSGVDQEFENVKTPENFKNPEQLKSQFEQNQKKIENLSSNIENLFKKISSLTQSISQTDDIKPKSEKQIKHVEIQHKFKSQTYIPYPPLQAPAKNQPIVPIFQIKHQEEKDQGISMKLFEAGKRLGYGKFGEVLECRNKETGMLYALKKIFKSTVEKYQMHNQLLTQLKACSQVDHPNIMKSYATFTDQFHIFLLCEHLCGKRLTKKFNSSEGQVSKIIYQVLQAIKYLHSKNITHRDLKPQNIIIEQSGLIKICDFGWSNFVDQEDRMKILCGTLDYVCPQMVLNKEYHKQVDLWSIGILTYELIFGKAPFQDVDRNSTFQRVRNLDYMFPESPKINPNCEDFIRKLLKPEQQRINIKDALNHQFIKNAKNQLKQFEFDHEITDLLQ